MEILREVACVCVEVDSREPMETDWNRLFEYETVLLTQ